MGAIWPLPPVLLGVLSAPCPAEGAQRTMGERTVSQPLRTMSRHLAKIKQAEFRTH